MEIDLRFKISRRSKVESESFGIFFNHTFERKKIEPTSFLKLNVMNFLFISTIFFFFFFVPSVSSRLVSREIKLERDSTLVSKFRKRGIKFDKGSKRRRKKKKKEKKRRMVDNETRHWTAWKSLNYYGARCN